MENVNVWLTGQLLLSVRMALVFSKKTYRDTRWMEKVMSITRPENSRGEDIGDWRYIDPKYTLLVHCLYEGWVETHFIRMVITDVLQCHTDKGIVQLSPNQHQRINVAISGPGV